METVAGFENRKNSRIFINTVSILVPLVVAVLLGLPNKLDLGAWTKILPHVIGIINTLTSFTLILGLIFILRNNVNRHQAMMTASFALGSLFLVCYVLYHLTNPSNKFAGTGTIRIIYLFILISHIGLSLVVLPLVLRAMFYALTRQFARHKKIVKLAFPIWLYVSITGVLVYLLNYQLFPGK